MPCVSFEDRLLDYGELSPAERETVDAHVARCEHCRQSLEAAAQLDAALAGLYSGARVAPALREAVLSRVSAQRPMTKPSFLPEVLDFIGWTGIIAAIVCLTTLLPQFRPGLWALAALSATIAIGAAIWAGVRSYADLK